MIAYKFLRSGRTGPFSEFRWPEPGTWVHARNDLSTCRSGIHACRTQDLPWWFAHELWEMELEGEVRFDEHKIVAPSGRLTSRIGEWTPACAQDYADACTWRTRDRAAAALSRAGHQQASDGSQRARRSASWPRPRAGSPRISRIPGSLPRLRATALSRRSQERRRRARSSPRGPRCDSTGRRATQPSEPGSRDGWSTGSVSARPAPDLRRRPAHSPSKARTPCNGSTAAATNRP